MKILFLASDPKQQGGIQRFNGNLIGSAEAAGAVIVPIFREGFGNQILFAIGALRVAFGQTVKIVWCGHIRFAPVGWILSFFGIRYAVFTHGIEVWQMNSFERMFLSRATVVVAISRYTRDRIIAQCPALEKRIMLLPNMVDGGIFSPAPPDLDYLKQRGLLNAKIILTVARLDKRERMKGHDRVVQALQKVLAAIPDAKYFIVGSGDDIPRIKTLAAEQGVFEAVIIRENVAVAELVKCYNAADVFVMPSRSEGFGIAYLEALACGTPAIAGNKDGSVDPLLDGELGILVDPDNIDEIAEAIIAVLKKTVPPRLTDAAFLRRRVLEVYGPQVFFQNVKRIMERFEPSV